TTATTTTLPLPPPPQQQSTTDPELANRVSTLEKICANFKKKNKLQDKTTQALSSRVYTLENHDLYSKIEKYVNEAVKESFHNALQAPIRERFRDLSEFEMKEILRDRMFKCGSYRSHPEHTTLYEVLEASMDRENREEFNEEMAKSRKRKRDDQDPPPPPPKDSDRSKNKKHDSDASASKQPPVQKSSAWKTSDTRGAPSSSSNKSLPLRGPPGHVIIQTQYFFNKDLEYLVSGDKERRNALSISKLKAAYYPDFRFKELVPLLWIESERDYDISSAYGISHWWFKRKEFYITRYSAPSNRSAVRSHMKILSVVSLKTFSRYGYTYLKEIFLRRADYKEYKILKADFKNRHPNDF
ncbi:hypothetical protein Tco_1082316, partial [Tanacetum coccineum]